MSGVHKQLIRDRGRISEPERHWSSPILMAEIIWFKNNRLKKYDGLFLYDVLLCIFYLLLFEFYHLSVVFKMVAWHEIKVLNTNEKYSSLDISGTYVLVLISR